MQTDTRSESPEQLNKTVSEIVNFAKMGLIEENARWKLPWDSKDNITVDIKLVGDRPGGLVESDAFHVQAAYEATKALGHEPKLEGPKSTDCNIPISLGIPALGLGGGGKGEKIHSLDECFDPTDAYLGPQRVFLIMLGLVGIDGLTKPLLPKHQGYEYAFSGVAHPDE